MELTGQEIRILLGVAARGTVRATVLSDELSLPRQTLHNGLPRLTPMYSKKRGQLSVPEIPLVARVKRPGQPYELRLSRTGQQLFREAGLLPSDGQAG